MPVHQRRQPEVQEQPHDRCSGIHGYSLGTGRGFSVFRVKVSSMTVQARFRVQVFPGMQQNKHWPTLQHPVLFASLFLILPLFPIIFSLMSALFASNQCFLRLRSHRPPRLLPKHRPSR